MYENQIESAIKERMLSRIKSGIALLEGTMLHDSAATTAIELQDLYVALATALRETFIATAQDIENIKDLAAESGIYQKEGQVATGDITFYGADNAVIPIGTTVQTKGKLMYSTIAEGRISNGQAIVAIKANGKGIIYNVAENTIVELPIQVIGVTSVRNEKPITGGTEDESKEALRERALAVEREEANSGNVQQYVVWAGKYAGIGKYKIFQHWNGVNTVKVLITDVTGKPADDNLIKGFQDYLDPGSTGLGNGVAPIGAVVTVDTGVPFPINISADITLSDGYTEPEGIEKAIEELFGQTAFTQSYISYTEVGAKLLGLACIRRIQNLLLNAQIGDILISDISIPIIGSLAIKVVNEY